jgi:hypothetical protein
MSRPSSVMAMRPHGHEQATLADCDRKQEAMRVKSPAIFSLCLGGLVFACATPDKYYPIDAADAQVEVQQGDAGLAGDLSKPLLDASPPDAFVLDIATPDAREADATIAVSDAPCGSPTDPRNCGSCGHDCRTLANVALSSAVACIAGSCVIPPQACATGYAHCTATPEDGCESNLTRSETCGHCGTKCNQGEICTSSASGYRCVSNCSGSGANERCMPPTPCHIGMLSCASGGLTCADTGVTLADGATCGPSLVCRGGACVPCTSSVACTPPKSCRTGSISCASGSPTCIETGIVSDGTSCGTNQVCVNGTCVSCTAGVACTPSTCQTGVTSCASGTSMCMITGTVVNGTSCGTNMRCSSGSCICNAGAACLSTNPCKIGTISCATGSPVCGDSADATDGTACGTSRVCSGGKCVSVLAPGASCSAGWQCSTSNCVDNHCCTQTSCPQCQDCGATGSCAPVPDNTDDDTCSGTLVCWDANNGGHCSACGSQAGVPCCAGGVCTAPGTACGSGGFCTACGTQAGAVCCAGSLCNVPGTYCDPSSNLCLSCGAAGGDPCCPGSHLCAGAGTGCAPDDDICRPCGEPGEPCCQSGGARCQTNGTLHCNSGPGTAPGMCVF